MKRLAAPLLLASLFLAAPAWAGEVTGLDRFRLWNNCQPMDLLVEVLDEKAAYIRLTREAITVAVRSRLRAARLYDELNREYWLYVRAGVGRRAFDISIEYSKRMTDSVSGESGYATTWDTGSFGTHAQDSSYILSWISRHTDTFIDEYLRVNADACK